MSETEYPVIWRHLTAMLIADYKVPPEKAFSQARKLIKSCRTFGMDIVASSWVFEPQERLESRKRDPLEAAIHWLAETEEAGRTPWYPEQ